MKILTGWVIASQLVCLTQAITAQEKKESAVTVAQIDEVSVNVRESMPPRLVVAVRATVSSGGHSGARLDRVKYRTPPADGIQEFRFVTRPPDGPATAVMSPVAAMDQWDTVVGDAPWIKGVRILGKGEGIREVMLEQDDLDRISQVRQFSGLSERGSFDEALQAALGEMNAAMADSRAVDGMVTWHLGPVSGRVGGFAGFNDMSVTIYAVRTPPWQPGTPATKKPDGRRRN